MIIIILFLCILILRHTVVAINVFLAVRNFAI